MGLDFKCDIYHILKYINSNNKKLTLAPYRNHIKNLIDLLLTIIDFIKFIINTNLTTLCHHLKFL
jgi:hypothetical protein